MFTISRERSFRMLLSCVVGVGVERMGSCFLLSRFGRLERRTGREFCICCRICRSWREIIGSFGDGIGRMLGSDLLRPKLRLGYGVVSCQIPADVYKYFYTTLLGRSSWSSRSYNMSFVLSLRNITPSKCLRRVEILISGKHLRYAS